MWYFWKDNTVIEFDPKDIHVVNLDRLYSLGLGNCYCFNNDSPTDWFRTGKYKWRNWNHTPIIALPKKFRTALLLLGIS